MSAVKEREEQGKRTRGREREKVEEERTNGRRIGGQGKVRRRREGSSYYK